MTVPNAVSVIRELVQHRENDVLIGAGTVTNAAQAESCILAGAQFLVSPAYRQPFWQKQRIIPY